MPIPGWQPVSREGLRDRVLKTEAQVALGERGRVTILPDLANHFRFTEAVSSPKIKNISLFRNENQAHIFVHPVLVRRASAVVTDVGRGAMDAEVVAGRAAAEAYGKDVWSRRRDAGVHAPGRRPISQGATEAKAPFSGEITL
jgi:hypothetical protein